MELAIPLAHDFTCGWCWVAFHQTRKLTARYPVRFIWKGFEMNPEDQPWPPIVPSQPDPKPPTPTRFQLFAELHGLELPRIVRPMHMHTHNAHEAVEFAKGEGVADALVAALYDAYWTKAVNINKIENLRELATGIVSDLDGMVAAIESKKFAKNITPLDESAAETGIYAIPTYTIGGKLYSEQPYKVIAKAIEAELTKQDEVSLYRNITFSQPPTDRPIVFMNMVTTIDGKTISGERDEPVTDLGSKVDHFLMKEIESHADAVILGATTLRATNPRWNPVVDFRMVLTQSGQIPAETAYLLNGRAAIVTHRGTEFLPPDGVDVIRAGDHSFDPVEFLKQLKGQGVERLLVYGGSEINAIFLRAGVVDELFWTIAPKIKLGRDLPTYAGGEPLPRELIQNYSLISHQAIGDEIFVRYRRKSTI